MTSKYRKMKILTSNQIYQADKATVKNKSISSADLMEHAATKCADWISEHFPEKDRIIHIFCGTGNNGGDGLVIARKLVRNHYQVKTYVVNFNEKRSDDFSLNFNRLLEMNHVINDLNEGFSFPEIDTKDLIIDAIFGIGLTRAPEGFVKEIIQKINGVKAKIISIDFPSGLFAESAVTDKESVIKAFYTLTFQQPKLAFLLPDNEIFSENFQVLDIGLDKNFITSLSTNYFTIDQDFVQNIYRPRKKFSHKGSFGHSLVIGGSYGKIGAMVLASKAALKAGSGLVTAYIPKCGYEILQTSNPEIMVEVEEEDHLQYFNFKVNPTVIGIGMGLGMKSKTQQGLEFFLKENKKKLVIDADALNILSKNREYLNYLPGHSVLTPHPKEFERLVGRWKNDFEKLEKLLQFSLKYDSIVILKGAYTAITFQHKIYFNTSGNPALATAGSGDVLAGIITGLIAQNYTPLEASILGVYLHGKTADLALPDLGHESFIATSILDYLPKAILELIKN
jgi:hydroxyethylthiazole kinase-like uncharacterized protein yjeF